MASDFLDALRPLFDCLSDGICVADAAGRLLYANAAAGELLGPKSEDASSAVICDLLCAGFEGCCVKDGISCPLKIPRGKQNSITFKGRYAPTGRELRLRCLRVRLPSLERHFLIIEDVTAQAEAGKQREAWRQMLAHDFRVPLSIALGALNSIQEIGSGRSLAASDLTLIENGVRNCLRLNALIGAYLDAARLEEGAIPVRAGPVDIERLVRDVIDELALAAQERGQKPTLTAQGTPVARADPELLRRALTNILGNAIKFTPPEGRIDVAASSREHDVLIRISDNGPGIPAQDLPRIFDRFYRGTGPGRHLGLGLGLTFCRAALRAMEGEVTVESEEGKGSVFTLRLPRSVFEKAAVGAIT